MCDGYISIYDSSKEGNIGGGDFLGLCKNIIAFSEHQMAVHQDFALVLAELALLLAEMALVLIALELILTALVLVLTALALVPTVLVSISSGGADSIISTGSTGASLF